MKRTTLFAALVLANAWQTGIFAGIPEPDAILYGQILIDGVAVGADAEVTIIARRDSDGNEIARYVMGENADACDSYVLRIPLELLVEVSSTQRTDTLLVGQTVSIYTCEAQSPESLVDALPIDDRGAVIYRDLGSRIPCDFNGDGRVSLVDHASFVKCMSSQGAAGGQCLAAFDEDDDGLITLADFAFFQRSFAPN